MGHWNVVRAAQCVNIFQWRHFRLCFCNVVLRGVNFRLKKICVCNLSAHRVTIVFLFRDARTHVPWHCSWTLKPILGDASKILFEDQTFKGRIKKVTKLIFLLCLRSFRSLAELIIPLLRTSHRVAFAVLVVKDLSIHRVAVAKIVLTEDRRVIPELTNLVAGSSMMHSARLLILYSPIAEFLLSAFHRSFESNPVSRTKRTMIPH